MRCFGPMDKAAQAIEVSQKRWTGEVRTLTVLLRLGDQASVDRMMKSSSNAQRYDAKVSSSNLKAGSEERMSAVMRETRASVEMFLAREVRTSRRLAMFFPLRNSANSSEVLLLEKRFL